MQISRRRATALIVLLAGSVLPAQNKSESVEQQAKRQVGEVATLCGTVVAYQCKDPERISLLALEKLPSGAGVSVAIAQDDRGKFGTLFEPRHVLAEVCATGVVEKRKNRYLVHVVESSQFSLRANSPMPMPFGPDAVAACDAGVMLPSLRKEVRPAYTRAATAARIEGVVWLEAVVLTTGEVGEVRILRSLDSTYGLDLEAIKALKAWRFSPGTQAGKPVPVVVTVELSFRLGS